MAEKKRNARSRQANEAKQSGQTVPLGKGMRTLAIDIGGSGLKMLVLDAAGKPITERTRVRTPKKPAPEVVLPLLTEMMTEHGDFERISVGFPGVVDSGVTHSAVNLHPDWEGLDLARSLGETTGKPTRVCNDADVQGLGVIEGQGTELVVTLGTGFGSSLFRNGRLLPNLELGHHPFRRESTYEESLGQAALDEVGKKRWNRRLQKAVHQLESTFNYRMLYIGGGNRKKIEAEFPSNVRLVENVAGLLGGIRLWDPERAWLGNGI